MVIFIKYLNTYLKSQYVVEESINNYIYHWCVFASKWASISCKSSTFLGLNLENFRIIVAFLYLKYYRTINYMFIKFYMPIFYHIKHIHIVTLSPKTPLWSKCENETHIPKSGNLESSRTPDILELDRKEQKTSPYDVLYTVGKVLKCRCRKWPPMSHSDICNTSCVRKKSREPNWQFDSRPLKVGNRPDPGVCRRSATHC